MACTWLKVFCIQGKKSELPSAPRTSSLARFFLWAKQKPLLTPYLLCLALFVPVACVSSPEPQVTTVRPPAEVSPLADIVAKSTQRYEVIDTFKTRHHLSVTRLAPEVQKALDERYQSIFSQAGSILSLAAGEIAFIVSVYSANQNLGELDDPKVWAIVLEHANSSKKPLRIQRLEPKEKIQAFIPHASPWSREYQVTFADSDFNSGATLVLSSPEGQVRANF